MQGNKTPQDTLTVVDITGFVLVSVVVAVHNPQITGQ